MAEREGFEPSVRLLTLHSLSRRAPSADSVISPGIYLAEEVGFEPTELSFNGFQDRRLKPLGHSSRCKPAVEAYRYRQALLCAEVHGETRTGRVHVPFPTGHVNNSGGQKSETGQGGAGRFRGGKRMVSLRDD